MYIYNETESFYITRKFKIRVYLKQQFEPVVTVCVCNGIIRFLLRHPWCLASLSMVCMRGMMCGSYSKHNACVLYYVRPYTHCSPTVDDLLSNVHSLCSPLFTYLSNIQLLFPYTVFHCSLTALTNVHLFIQCKPSVPLLLTTVHLFTLYIMQR